MSSSIQTSRELGVPARASRRAVVTRETNTTGDVGFRIPRTVLIVEDGEDLRSVIAHYLKTKGYKVLEARDGKEAIEVAEANRLDLMLVDFELPVLNGLGIVQHLRKQMKFEALPIVMITSYQGDDIHANAVAVGCDEFLHKPIDFDRLDASLDYFVPSEITATPPNSWRSI